MTESISSFTILTLSVLVVLQTLFQISLFLHFFAYVNILKKKKGLGLR